jgi:hypothetical protein
MVLWGCMIYIYIAGWRSGLGAWENGSKKRGLFCGDGVLDGYWIYINGIPLGY